MLISDTATIIILKQNSMKNKHYIINAVSLILESDKLINIILTNSEETTDIEQQRAIIREKYQKMMKGIVKVNLTYTEVS